MQTTRVLAAAGKRVNGVILGPDNGSPFSVGVLDEVNTRNADDGLTSRSLSEHVPFMGEPETAPNH
jgi:hypothetical protein